MACLWTQQEITYLRDNYRTQPVQATAIHLDRSIKAVQMKAFRLFGLHPDRTPDLPSLNLPQTIAAYLAGFIDADGYIGGHISWRDGHPITFVGQITVSCADKTMIDWLTAHGFRNRWNKPYILSQTETRYRLTRQHYYANVTNRPKIIPLLKAILPHLKLKRHRAELLLQFYRQHVPRTSHILADWQLIFALYQDIGSNHPKAINARKRLADYIAAQERIHNHDY